MIKVPSKLVSSETSPWLAGGCLHTVSHLAFFLHTLIPEVSFSKDMGTVEQNRTQKTSFNLCSFCEGFMSKNSPHWESGFPRMKVQRGDQFSPQPYVITSTFYNYGGNSMHSHIQKVPGTSTNRLG